MSKIITVIYGSSTGNTEHAAQAIAGKLGGRAVNIRNASAADFQADLLILGTSTWGCGELQDDWMNGVALLETADLSGKLVAFFGLGDAVGFGDTYLNGMGELAEKAVARGAKIVGRWPSEGYMHSLSTAEEGGFFAGLALDDDNAPGETADRIDRWCEQLRREAAL